MVTFVGEVGMTPPAPIMSSIVDRMGLGIDKSGMCPALATPARVASSTLPVGPGHSTEVALISANVAFGVIVGQFPRVPSDEAKLGTDGWAGRAGAILRIVR